MLKKTKSGLRYYDTKVGTGDCRRSLRDRRFELPRLRPTRTGIPKVPDLDEPNARRP